MEFETLLQLIENDPLFESSLLLAGDVDPQTVRLQLTRWVKSGRIVQLRRGLYALSPPYQKTKPQPFLVANRLQPASYVSLQTALAFYGLIPETVQITLSVGTGRPERLQTPLGMFEFRHIKPELLFGYQITDLGGQGALVALPEKALLDLLYLHPGPASAGYLQGLRLQNLDRLDLDVLHKYAAAFHSPKLSAAANQIQSFIETEPPSFEDL